MEKFPRLQPRKKICDVYGNDTITEKTCQRWLKRFKEGNFDLEDQQCTGRKRRLSLQDLDSRISKNPKTKPESWLLLLNAHQ